MCGIAGWVDWKRDLSQQHEIIREMTETLSRRGPDSSGYWSSKRAILGHRRLVVVDAEGGKQPMVRQRGDATFAMVYNGELYNTPELRRDLEALGYHFKGYSDTETLLLAYMEWGGDCLRRLNGIFAFAVWDTQEQTLFMARDRLGVKPLFYAMRGHSFLFGSELKAILAHPEVKAEIDEEGLNEIFSLGPARTPGHGVFRGVSELRPGHCLLLRAEGMQITRYWALQSRVHREGLDETADRVRELLSDAVCRQLVSDVPLGVLLSGGLDSSAITAVAAMAFKHDGRDPLHTWSVDYEGNARHFRSNAFQPDADGPWITRMSEAFGTTQHHVVLPQETLAESLRAAMRGRDLPGMADVDSSLYLFCHEIKQGITVALSGESADEVFGGYPWFHRESMIEADTFPWAMQRPRFLETSLRDRIRPRDYIAARYRETLSETPRLEGESRQAARMREIGYLSIVWFLTTLLDRKDRMSMAHGLEVRVPFCDHRLVEYVWNIPWEMKACDGQAKGILRRALRGILPEDVLNRRKSPYPKTHHPAYLAAVRQGMREIMADPTSPLVPLLNKTLVQEMVGEGQELPEIPWFGQLMTGPQLLAYLIQVDAWMREYKVNIV